jgi:hypothetical protein
MQTSCVRHPQRSRYLKIHDWQLEATGGNQAAAALINFFAYHHDRALDAKEYTKMRAGELMVRDREELGVDENGWQFHTDAFIEAGVLGLWKRDTIQKGIAVLVEIGFLENDPPVALRLRYRTGRIKGLRFRADRVRLWLDEHAARQHPPTNGGATTFRLDPETAPPPATPKTAKTRAPKPLLDDLKDVDVFTVNDARAIFEDWRVVHDHPDALPTPERLRYIVKLLLRGYSVTRLKIACRGVLFSAWHQGTNDRKKTWDKISIIFEDGEKVEEFEELALKNHVTADTLANFVKKPKAARPLTDKPDWQRAIDNCPMCDERGRVEIDGAITVCTHQQKVEKPINDSDIEQEDESE